MSQRHLSKKGFTLIEVLLVIGIITILMAIVIIAINPAYQFAQSRNTQRWSNVNTILNAIHQYSVVHQGNISQLNITTTEKEICKTSGSVCTSSGFGGNGLVDLGLLFYSDQKYLVEMPEDPYCDTSGYFCDPYGNGTGYTVKKTINDRIIVNAPSAELDEEISVTR